MSLKDFPLGRILISLILSSGCSNVSPKPSPTLSSSPVISGTPTPSVSPVSNNENKNPDFINQQIANFMKQRVQNPPITINQYDYKGKKVYYIPPYCCDIPSELYDQDGKRICSPDGGMSGDGDGKCSDFFSERKNEKLIWKDPRT